MTNKTPTAVVFPGQGSQQVGMLADLAERWPTIQDVFDRASTVLGYDLWQLTQQGPQDTLNLTAHAQPALLTASYAVWQVMRSGPSLDVRCLAGHSLGEWSALVAAGVLTFEDAVRLVERRGQYMQQAVPVGEGAMAAVIGLADDAIVHCCEQAAAGEQVMAVNFNSPGQVVIAGHQGAVTRATEHCKNAGAKLTVPLPVSAPFHTPLMKPAAERLAIDVDATEFFAPQIPVVHNVHAQTETDPQAIKRLMIEQIYTPVQWVRCVEQMQSQGITSVCECGPGKVLSGLVRRIDKSIKAVATDSVSALDGLLST